MAYRSCVLLIALSASAIAQNSANLRIGASKPNSLAAVVCPKAQKLLEANNQTEVTVHMVVSEEGSVESFQFVSPKGLHLEKDKEVRNAVKGTRFTPARKDGQPVTVQILYSIDCSSSRADFPSEDQPEIH